MAIPVKTTSPDADRVHVELLRAAGTAKRFQVCDRLTTSVIALAKQAIRRRNPGLSELEVGIRFVELHYGAELAQGVRAHLDRHRR